MSTNIRKNFDDILLMDCNNNNDANIEYEVSGDKKNINTFKSDLSVGVQSELDKNAAYFSRTAHLIDVKDIPMYYKAIVCDLFGNDSDSRIYIGKK